MKNLILNSLMGDKIFESLDLEIYFKSLKKIKNADKFCIVRNISLQNLKVLEKIYDKLIFPERDYFHYFVHFIYLDTLIKYAQNYENVLYVDSRDVIIQKNPFEFMENNSQFDLFLFAEGMKIYENEMNMIWHQHLKSTQYYHSEKSEEYLVINGGTFGGKPTSVINHLMLSVTNTNRKAQGLITDQAIYSDLFKYYSQLKNIHIAHPYNSLLHATGEAIKRNNVKVKYISNQVCNLNDEPYYIFHQWDRTEYADEIRNKHKNTLSFEI